MQQNLDSTTKAENSATPAIQSGEKSPSAKARAGSVDRAPRKAKSKPRPDRTVSKSDLILKLLRQKNGATIEALSEAAGWQHHTVRGFLSGTVKKKLGLPLTNETGKDGKRRYRIAASAAVNAQ
ncbi:MAG: DUF3489 domain-containing protein [Oricola sp.]